MTRQSLTAAPKRWLDLGAGVALCALGVIGLGGEAVGEGQPPQCRPATIRPYEGDPDNLTGYSGKARIVVEACVPGNVGVGVGGFSGGFIGFDFARGPSGVSRGFEIDPCNDVAANGSDLPGTNVSISFYTTPEIPAARGAQAFSLAADDEPPKITEITPRSGTKVRPGQRMTIKVTASEHYDDGNVGWQTGVRSIRVQDLASHSELPPWNNESPRARPCTAKTWRKSHDMDFRVPNPPPETGLVRLRVLVRDYANETPPRDIVYPTKGNWYGTLTWKHRNDNPVRTPYPEQWADTNASADILLEYDGRGGLTGTLIGSHSSKGGPHCATRTVGAGTMTAALVGSHTPGRDSMMLRVSDKRTTPIRMASACGGGMIERNQPFISEIYERALRNLKPTPDGGFTSGDDQVLPGSGEAGSMTTTISYELKLNPIRN